jgi:transposase
MKRLEIENKGSIIAQIRNYLERNSESKFIHRLQVLLLLADTEKETCNSLGALFGNSPRTISNWVKKLNKTGNIESLRSKPLHGRPSRLSKEQKNVIKAALQELPEKHGAFGKQWNGKNLSLYINRRFGITLRVRSCQRLLCEFD